MIYFTKEIIEESSSEYAPKYINACKRYLEYFNSIKKYFSKSFVQFYLQQFFHDDNLVDLKLNKRYLKSGVVKIDLYTTWKASSGENYKLNFIDVTDLKINIDLQNYTQIGDNIINEFSYSDGTYSFEVYFHDESNSIFVKSKQFRFRIMKTVDSSVDNL